MYLLRNTLVLSRDRCCNSTAKTRSIFTVGKVNVHPKNNHEGTEGKQRYLCSFFNLGAK